MEKFMKFGRSWRRLRVARTSPNAINEGILTEFFANRGVRGLALLADR